ncbi:ornithine cyclodeaminase family protein [Streptomyces sp. NPDC018693]|uniref:ornithine cyclodeaminase family protein n=1 Tax=unclassified Streptomyces TaxID=2593676 RepID=UPI00379A294F
MSATAPAGSPVPAVPVLTEAQVRRLLPQDRVLEATRQALIAHAAGAVSQPAPWHLEVTGPGGSPQGEVHVKGAHLHGAPHYAIKLATGFYGNRALGLPVSGGLSVVADAATGHPVLIVLDNGYLTDIRTGAAGALATHALARADARRIALIGPGAQAEHQLRALLRLRRPADLVLHGRDRDRAEAFADRARALHPWRVTVAADAEEAVRGADIVLTVTPSRQPVVRGEWLGPGTHITAVGADMEGKRELDASVLRRAVLVAADDPDQCRRTGELQHAAPAGTTASPRVEALGHILAGVSPGRRSAAEITVADLTGLGAQDSAVAALLAARALRTSDRPASA